MSDMETLCSEMIDEVSGLARNDNSPWARGFRSAIRLMLEKATDIRDRPAPDAIVVPPDVPIPVSVGSSSPRQRVVFFRPEELAEHDSLAAEWHESYREDPVSEKSMDLWAQLNSLDSKMMRRVKESPRLSRKG